MDPRYALKASTDQERRLRAQAMADAVAVDFALGDPDKARVLAHFRDLVSDGYAEWHTQEDGTIQLRLNTGEIYLLGRTAITRIE